jgi:hypothetical protein
LSMREIEGFLRSRGLLPHQVDIGTQFLADESVAHYELVMPVGTGKTTLAVAVISYAFTHEGFEHVIVLVPAPLRAVWQTVMEREQTTAGQSWRLLVLDHGSYLELDSAVRSGRSMWPARCAVLVSVDLAKQASIAASILSAHWDLLVTDDCHVVAGQRRQLIENLLKPGHVRRSLLLASTPGRRVEGTSRFVVKDSDLLNWDGQPVFPRIEIRSITLTYKRTPDEVTFLRATQLFCDRLAELGRGGQFLSRLLPRRAASSNYALEETLRRLREDWRHLRNMAVHGMHWSGDDMQSLRRLFEDEEYDPSYGGDALPVISERHRSAILALFSELENLLARLDDLPVDSKLDALRSFLGSRIRQPSENFLCVWSSYASTAQYVCSNLQRRGMTVHAVTGGMTPAGRAETVDSYRRSGGILVLTDAAASGLDLRFVQDSVNYDLPSSRVGLEQRRGRFARIGRSDPLAVVFLRDESRCVRWEEETFSKLVGEDGR